MTTAEERRERLRAAAERGRSTPIAYDNPMEEKRRGERERLTELARTHVCGECGGALNVATGSGWPVLRCGPHGTRTETDLRTRLEPGLLRLNAEFGHSTGGQWLVNDYEERRARRLAEADAPLLLTCWRCRAEYDYITAADATLTHCGPCQEAGYGPTPAQDARRLEGGVTQ